MPYAQYAEFLESIKASDEYLVESAKMDFALELNSLMNKQGVTRTALAKTISKTPAYLSKVLKGDTNFTIETMVKLCSAINHKISFHIAPKDAATRWFDVIDSSTYFPLAADIAAWQQNSADQVSTSPEYRDGKERLAA
jgi:transcriptional regulator with XRE-family HTH domain